jgi:hypothetical protein
MSCILRYVWLVGMLTGSPSILRLSLYRRIHQHGLDKDEYHQPQSSGTSVRIVFGVRLYHRGSYFKGR